VQDTATDDITGRGVGRAPAAAESPDPTALDRRPESMDLV
jgi:hypothetical protein